jgi:predicted DNA-binding transcriptional regulator AlpA
MSADDLLQLKICRDVQPWPDLWPPLGQRRRIQRKRCTPSIQSQQKESAAYVSRGSLAARLDCAESTVDELVKRGVLPKPFKLSSGVVRWCWSDVEAAIKSMQRGNSTERDPYLVGVENVVIKKSKA